ncbi:MAG: hypothetical protein WD512_18870 [Candidatus Paceibacterota bacterium]
MDLKLVDFQKRIPKEYQSEVFNYIVDHIDNPDTEFKKIWGRTVSYLDLRVERLGDADWIPKTIHISMVKNKTCYTIYTHLNTNYTNL